MHLLRCPVCRAKLTGDEPREEPCRRCNSDLSFVRQAYEGARWWRCRAREALAAGRDEEALSMARRAVALVDAEQTRATLASALVALERPSAALAVMRERERTN